MASKKIEKLYCSICGNEIPDPEVAFKIPDKNEFCCVECYFNKGVICEKILKEIREEDIKRRYGADATVEKRFFGKKEE